MIKPSPIALISVFWACISAPHDRAPFTRAQVADMVDQAGGFDALGRPADPGLTEAWARILVNAGVMDRTSAEAAGFIPGSRKPDPKDEAAADAAKAPEAATTTATVST